MEVLLHRVIWSFIFVTAILLVRGWQGRFLSAWKQPALLRGLALSSLLVSVNWLIFIWAVGQGRVLESSLGYFLTPLVSVFLARVFLHEQLNRQQIVAIILATCGVLWLVLKLGQVPWVSISLALSFGLYGLARKKIEVDTVTGLGVETALLLPIAIVYWIYLSISDVSHFSTSDMDHLLLLMASGVVTATPLLLFAFAARRLTLTVVGFMMYINPSLQFAGALWILEEPFNQDQFIGFCFIWAALLVFSLGTIRRGQSVEQH
jgi:chloramphenicol-sensitive protein RarD